MVWFFKAGLFGLVAVGLYVAYLGISGLLGTWSFFRLDVAELRGTFVGYRHEMPERLTDQTKWVSYQDRNSLRPNAFPTFRYQGADGEEKWVESGKEHLFELLKENEPVAVWLPEDGSSQPRLGGWYSLYFYDGFLAAFGLLFVLVPALLMGKVELLVGPIDALLQTPAFAPYRAYVVLGLKFVLVAAGAIILLSQVPRLYRGITGFSEGAKFLEAIERGDRQAIDQYLAEDVDVGYVNKHDQNALLLALRQDDLKLAHELIRRGSDVTLRSKMDQTPLSFTAMKNDTEGVKLIMERGAKIDEREKTSLMWAVAHGNTEMLRAMLASKPDLAKLYRFDTKLGDAAKSRGLTEAVEMIRAAGGTFSDE